MEPKYTIVQHSGFGYKGDRQFEKGLEVRTVTLKREIDLVEKVGGLLFDDWNEADDFAEEAPYKDNATMIPQAKGTFSEKTIDGLRIYVPVREVVG